MLGGHRQCTPFFCYWHSFKTSGPSPGITRRTRREDSAALCMETTDGLAWLRNAPGSFASMHIPGCRCCGSCASGGLIH